jgi:hypothetical protein
LEGKSLSILIGSLRMRRPWIGRKDFINFHWTKKISSKKGHEKLGKGGVREVSYCVIFPRKGKRRKMVQRGRMDWRLVVL